MGLLTSLENWFKQPFNSSQNALGWVLFLGLIIIAGFLWNLVLLSLIKEV